MPYIKKTSRDRFVNALLRVPLMTSKGELEFCVYYLMVLYMKVRKQCYSDLHDTVYAVHHAADEYRRRHLDKREDAARKANGDIAL